MGRYLPHAICVLAILFIFGFGYALGHHKGSDDSVDVGAQQAFSRALALVKTHQCENDACRDVREAIFTDMVESSGRIKEVEPTIRVVLD